MSTHGGLSEMVDIVQMKFSNAFLNEKFVCLNKMLIKLDSDGLN